MASVIGKVSIIQSFAVSYIGHRTSRLLINATVGITDKGSHFFHIFHPWSRLYATAHVHTVAICGSNGPGNILRRQTARQNQRCITGAGKSLPIKHLTGAAWQGWMVGIQRSEEHTSELQSR